MVEVKLVCGAACYTFSPVSLPYRELYRCGDHSTPLNVSFGRTIEALVSLNSNESVLENFTVFVTFAPTIYQVVRPYPCLDLFIYSNTLRIALSSFIQLSGVIEFSILCQSTGRKSFGLIHNFWIRRLWALGKIVPLVDERRSAIFEPISIRCVSPNRHQYHRVITTNVEIHSLLKTYSLASAHLHVRNNVITRRYNSWAGPAYCRTVLRVQTFLA
jgi:hypothetical protein